MIIIEKKSIVLNAIPKNKINPAPTKISPKRKPKKIIPVKGLPKNTIEKIKNI